MVTEVPLASIDASRELLESLRECEAQIERLSSRRTDLEVDAIVARVVPVDKEAPGVSGVLSSVQTSIMDLDPALACTLVRVVDRQREVRAALGRGRQQRSSSPEAQARLGDAIDALTAWVTPGDAGASLAVKRIMPWVILVSVSAAGWAAWALHPAMLLLLLPLGGAVSFFSGTGQDAQFRKIGAQRRFDLSSQKPPATWTESAVRARLGEMQVELDEARRAAAAADVPTEQDLERRAELTVELEELEVEFYTAAMNGGLDPSELSEKVLGRLREATRGERARRDIEQLEAQLDALRDEAAHARETLFRTLAAAGLAPEQGRADYAVLAKGIECLEGKGQAHR